MVNNIILGSDTIPPEEPSEAKKIWTPSYRYARMLILRNSLCKFGTDALQLATDGTCVVPDDEVIVRRLLLI